MKQQGKGVNQTISTQSLQGFTSNCSGRWDKNGRQDVVIAASHLDPLKAPVKKASLGANQGQTTAIESSPCQVPGHLPGCEQCHAKIQGVGSRLQTITNFLNPFPGFHRECAGLFLLN